jgi:hypothetical protein
VLGQRETRSVRENEKKAWMAGLNGEWARNRIWGKWVAETVFQILEQGFKFKIKGFKYFQTEFELRLNWDNFK